MYQATLSHRVAKQYLDQLDRMGASDITKKVVEDLNGMKERRGATSIEIQFIDETIGMSKDFYLVPPINSNEPSIGFVTKNLNGVMHLAVNRARKEFRSYYETSDILDLLHIHSFKKGEGKKLMQLYLSLHQNLKISGSLWTETDDNVQYFEKFGFESLGRQKGRNDILMRLVRLAKT